MQEHDIIVVGIGAMGSSACFELARRGVRVLGIEQFDVPNDLGSSHGLTRMIRMAYYEHPNYVPLLVRAYDLWGELEQLCGVKLLQVTGGLYMGPGGCELVEGSVRTAREHGLEHEMLDGGQIMRRFGAFDVPPDWVGLMERPAGFLLPEKVIEAYARLARGHGAEVHARERVLEWSADGSGVKVRTDRGEYRAGRIIFSAGAWTDKLVKDLGIRLTVTRQVMLWFTPREPALLELGRLPVWAIDRAGGGLYYGFPMLTGDTGVKISCHWPAETTDPDHVIRETRPEDSQEVRQIISKHVPAAGGEVVDARVCLYTNTPDSHFIIDQHPRHDRVILACGFSGHGFKFASVVGEILADLATRGSTELPVRFLGLGR